MANFKDIEQEQLVGYWIKRFEIKRQDLIQHPSIDDVILLCHVRQFVSENKGYINSSEQAQLGAIWGYVYKKKYPLKGRYIRTLESIVNKIQNCKQAQQEKIKQARQTLRQTQRDYDMMAKESLADTSVPWEV